MPTSLLNYASKSEFEHTLKLVAFAQPHHAFALKKNKLIRVHLLDSDCNTTPVQIADHFIQVLRMGASRHWVQASHLILIEKAAQRIGLIPPDLTGKKAQEALQHLYSDSPTVSSHKSLVGHRIKPIAGSKQDIPFETLLTLIRETPILNQSDSTDLTMQAFEWLMGYPYNPDTADGLEAWILDIFLIGEMHGLEQAHYAGDRLADLDKIDFKNAFALLANAYRLAYFIQHSRLATDKHDWLVAGEIFLSYLKRLIEQHPDEFKAIQQKFPLPLKMDKELIDPNFKIKLDHKRQALVRLNDEDDDSVPLPLVLLGMSLFAAIVWSRVFN